jgi:hypothetical protein
MFIYQEPLANSYRPFFDIAWDVLGPDSHDVFVFIKVEPTFKNHPSIRLDVEKAVSRYPIGAPSAVLRDVPLGIFRREGQWMFITNPMKKIIPMSRRRKILILRCSRNSVLQ